MALIQRDFRKDKPKPVKLRIVCGVKILTPKIPFTEELLYGKIEQTYRQPSDMASYVSERNQS